MKFLTILLSVLALTGCATGCQRACVFGIGPGNSMFDSYANYSDNNDLCQYKGKEPGYKLPNFCGASSGKVVHINKVSNNSYLITNR